MYKACPIGSVINYDPYTLWKYDSQYTSYKDPFRVEEIKNLLDTHKTLTMYQAEDVYGEVCAVDTTATLGRMSGGGVDILSEASLIKAGSRVTLTDSNGHQLKNSDGGTSFGIPMNRTGGSGLSPTSFQDGKVRCGTCA